MPQMTHTKPIPPKKIDIKQFLKGLEQYRERTSMFPHASDPVIPPEPLKLSVDKTFTGPRSQKIMTHYRALSFCDVQRTVRGRTL